MKKLLTLTILFISALNTRGQKDTLPDFSVKNIKGEIVISWYNPLKNVIQINIQRSKESNKNFITIHSTPDSKARYYRFTDKTAPHDSCYYRIFMLFEGTNYQFSKIQRPLKTAEMNTAVIVEVPMDSSDNKSLPVPEKKEIKKITIQIPTEKKQVQEIINIEKKIAPNEIKSQIIAKEIHLALQKHHYLLRYSNDLFRFYIPAPPSMKIKKTWNPSPYIFTSADGNIYISLPDVKTKKYTITFLKEEGRPLFVIDTMSESPIVIDKSSFLKSGWYYFELREEGKVLERNKFLLTKDN